MAEGKHDDKDPTMLRELRTDWWRNEPGSQGACPSSLVVVSDTYQYFLSCH